MGLVIGVFLRFRLVQQPDPTENFPMTTAPLSYTSPRDVTHSSGYMNLPRTTHCHKCGPNHQRPRPFPKTYESLASNSWDRPPYMHSCRPWDLSTITQKSVGCERTSKQPETPFAHRH